MFIGYSDLDIDALSKRWLMLVVRGIAAIAFGVLAMVWPSSSLLALVLVWGAYALIDGTSSVALAVRAGHTGKRWGWLLFDGLVGIGAAIVTVLWPQITALALFVLIAVWAVITGIARTVAAIALRRVIPGEWMLGLSGLLSIVFGVLLMLFPGTGALAVVTGIGAYAVVFGTLLTVLGFRVRSLTTHAKLPPDPRHPSTRDPRRSSFLAHSAFAGSKGSSWRSAAAMDSAVGTQRLETQLRHLQPVGRWGHLGADPRERFAHRTEDQVPGGGGARRTEHSEAKSSLDVPDGHLDAIERPHPREKSTPGGIGLRLGEEKAKPDTQAEDRLIQAEERRLDCFDEVARHPLRSRSEQLVDAFEMVVERATGDPGRTSRSRRSSPPQVPGPQTPSKPPRGCASRSAPFAAGPLACGDRASFELGNIFRVPTSSNSRHPGRSVNMTFVSNLASCRGRLVGASPMTASRTWRSSYRG